MLVRMSSRFIESSPRLITFGWVFIPIVLYITHYANGILLTGIDVPSVALEGDEVRLLCNYKAEGGSGLYTLKWYKDQVEFYRHLPGSSPYTTKDRCNQDFTYAVEGVKVDCWLSTEREVILQSVTRMSSGEYKCEVIGEHPNFRKAQKSGRLSVYSEPLQEPLIEGNKESYDSMDTVALNCSSSNKEYIPTLNFSINGKPTNSSYLKYYGQRTVELTFKAHSSFFHRGIIEVECVSSISSKHTTSTKVQLSSRDYLSAQEYSFSAGKKLSSGQEVAFIFSLTWICFTFLFPLA